MVFACQRNSFLKEFESTVESCKENSIVTVFNGKKIKLNGYDVILQDTIIFPEGGGQPCDFGFINDIRVENVRRVGDKAVHFLDKPVKEGQSVLLKIDWDRRFDHMQQHSGQHLISAVIDRDFGYSTTSWWLGQDISHIELDIPNLKEEEILNIENVANEFIRNSTPVTVAECDTNDPILKEVRSRGLPDDHTGKVRVVTIVGLEDDMCCGTHVNNLSQLQMVKLVKAEKGKKGKVNLEFLVGGRVIKQLNTMYQREQYLTNLLKNSPSVHADLVEKLQKSLKVSNKSLQSVLKDLASYEAKALINTVPKPKYFCSYRQDADSDFMNIFIKEVGDEDILLLLTVGEDKGPGQMILHGKADAVSHLGPQICDLLEGKGVAKGNRFQAKVKNLTRRDNATKLIEEYFE
ncbi:alanyl-tRNA editing protein Aarsd1 [Lycorma delicatula]|uniref:alanyl-tRNA editing protein Aarsd1 n=1 Tax=Lycorma delicatula TaxID=130591 RepID=UPI003F512BA0